MSPYPKLTFAQIFYKDGMEILYTQKGNLLAELNVIKSKVAADIATLVINLSQKLSYEIN